MAEQAQPSPFIQCTGCGRELSRDITSCPFCGQALVTPGAQLEDFAGDDLPQQPLADSMVAAPRPVDRTRFALAGTVGLLVALILGYAWYLLAVQAEREYALVALVIGLVVGLVVALVSEGNLAVPYRILGAILAAGSVAFGQFLIYARPQSSFYFEFSAILLLIYAMALLEGWQAPQIAARRGLFKSGLIAEDNQGVLLGASLVLLAALIGAGFVSGILVGPSEVQAKMHATRAVTLLEEGDFVQASSELQLALEDHEAYADGHFFLGLLQANNIELVDAGEHFSRALEIGLDGERFAEAHYQLGLIDWIADESQTALEHLNLAIDHETDHVEAYLIRGAILLETDQPVAAASDINQALSLGLDAGDEEWAREMLQGIEAGD